MTPTARTLKWLRECGYQAYVVEQTLRVPGRMMFRRDLAGFADILAWHATETVLVQCTSASNVSSRCKKISEECAEAALSWLPRSIWVVGWKKYAKAENGRYWRVTVRVARELDGKIEWREG